MQTFVRDAWVGKRQMDDLSLEMQLWVVSTVVCRQYAIQSWLSRVRKAVSCLTPPRWCSHAPKDHHLRAPWRIGVQQGVHLTCKLSAEEPPNVLAE